MVIHNMDSAVYSVLGGLYCRLGGLYYRLWDCTDCTIGCGDCTILTVLQAGGSTSTIDAVSGRTSHSRSTGSSGSSW